MTYAPPCCHVAGTALGLVPTSGLPSPLMSLNLQQLRAFTTIVETGSLGRAATELHLTQPALSRTIKRLEADLGAPLLSVTARGWP